MSTARKLKKALGIKKGDTEPPMRKLTEADVRPGGWKDHVQPAKINKNRHVPVLIDDQIVEDVADGKMASEIEATYELREGYVRAVLLRKFGSIEGMKRACQAQCLENAIALNDYAASRLDQIPPDRALVGAKIMIDGALALEKSRVDRPSTVDFAAIVILGQTLERVEKKISGTDRTLSLTDRK